ncbi:MAG: hypothetical protein ACM3Q4_09745 [Acidobacteriota bacterium]
MMKLQPTKLVLALLLVVGVSFAGRPFEISKDKFKKAATNDAFMAIDINNIFNYYVNNGDGALNPYTEDDGFEIMNARRGQVLFEEGFVWGGIHKGIIKVGGSSYSHSLQAGPIITPGTATTAPVAADAGDPKYRIYRVRPDIGPGKTQADVQAQLEEEVGKLSRYEGTTPAQLYALYIKDWNEWPAAQGAPFTDVNKNGTYEPGTDIPGVPGASQTLWYVANDLDATRANAFHRTKPIGIEFQRTIWAYNRTGALGNTIFQKNILINKSGAPVDSMFVAQWADPDNGGSLGYQDDFVGCDTVRSLGFVYNADNDDGFFGAQPPAAGFDFFQGPRVKTGVATDKAIWKGAVLNGYKNLPMTAFNFSVNSSSTYADATENSAAGIQEWYNLFNGLVGRTGASYTNPVTGKKTTFTLSGDPVTGKGWVDGQIAAPGDRRMSLCSGPFTMAPGDTQEVVVAAIAAQSTNRLASVALLKYYDDLAQSAYDAFFQIAQPPAQPAVTVSELDKEVVLDWSNPANFQITESQNDLGYKFEGYNVYQLPSAGFVNPKLLATYDLTNGVYTIADQVFSEQYGTTVTVPVQNGNDLGLKRYFVVDHDYVNDRPFVNGQKYYFAVTAYNYNPDPKAVPTTIESAPKILTVIPQSAPTGTRFGAAAADTLKVTHAAGAGDGVVTPIVLDPKRLTGNGYKVTYDTLGGETVWSLTNTTTGQVLLRNQKNQTGDEDYAGVDGFYLKVQGPPPGMKGWEIPAGTRVWSWSGGTGFGLEGFTSSTEDKSLPGAMGNAYDHWFTGGVPYDRQHTILIKFAATDADGNVDANDPNVSYAYRYLRGATAAAAKPEFAAFIINKTAGYPFQDFTKKFPFAAWDVDVTPARRLAVGHLENNVAGGLVDGKYWPGLTSVDNVAGTGPREWWFIFDVDYKETPDPALQKDILNNEVPMMWMGTPARRSAGAWAAGNQFLLKANHIATKADVYTFSSTAPVTTVENGKVDIEKINVFPNPYFGFNSKEANKYSRFVTFNHLPAKATLNILNLAGVRVRTLMKNDPAQFLNWDLKNESGLPVAAGMYVVYIDMGELGTKIVKLAIIPEVQQLDKY